MRTTITINQDNDTCALREITPLATLTYLYDRSRDSKQGKAPGQDFIAFRYDDTRLAFAVCDGVSQSFYGDLAARFVGQHLVEWFSQTPIQEQTFADVVLSVLQSWTAEATALVENKPLSAALPPMIRDALERKRKNGSEAMFVAGQLDFDRNQLAVTWMGDMRLWLWDQTGQPLDLPGAVWETRERWSTRLGPKNGMPHTAVLPLDSIGRLTVHTDGIGNRTADLTTITLDGLDQLAKELAAAPTSDDMSVLDIVPGQVEAPRLDIPHLHLPDPDEPVLRWEVVEGAEWYRLRVETSSQQWTADTFGTTFFIPPVLPGGCFRVQALASDSFPSDWSDEILVGQPATEESAPVEGIEEGPVIGTRPFRLGLVLALALILALMISVGWYVWYLQPYMR